MRMGNANIVGLSLEWRRIEMTNSEAIYIFKNLINIVHHLRGDGKSFTKLMMVDALSKGIDDALAEQEITVHGGLNK